MFWFYITIIIILSLLVILLCLLQSSKKEASVGGVIESSSFVQIVGVRKTTDILEKLTLSFCFLIFSLSILSYLTITSSRRRKIKIGANKEIQENNSKDEKNSTK